MPYVAPDGTIYNSQPWSVNRIKDIFWGLIFFFVYFFTTLTDPIFSVMQGNTGASGPSRWTSNFRRGGWGGGGGSGGPRGPFGGGGGPNRRIGRFKTISDIQTPGGCCGGGGCPR